MKILSNVSGFWLASQYVGQDIHWSWFDQLMMEPVGTWDQTWFVRDSLEWEEIKKSRSCVKNIAASGSSVHLSLSSGNTCKQSCSMTLNLRKQRCCNVALLFQDLGPSLPRRVPSMSGSFKFNNQHRQLYNLALFVVIVTILPSWTFFLTSS